MIDMQVVGDAARWRPLVCGAESVLGNLKAAISIVEDTSKLVAAARAAAHRAQHNFAAICHANLLEIACCMELAAELRPQCDRYAERGNAALGRRQRSKVTNLVVKSQRATRRVDELEARIVLLDLEIESADGDLWRAEEDLRRSTEEHQLAISLLSEAISAQNAVPVA